MVRNCKSCDGDFSLCKSGHCYPGYSSRHDEEQCERKSSVTLIKVSQLSGAVPGGRVTNAVGTIFRKIFVGTRAPPI